MENYFCQYVKIQNNISIIEKLENAKKENRSIVFLCVGNSKVWFDSFGPFVGSFLQMCGIEYFVYGNIRSNVLIDNIDEFIEMIYRFHVNPFIIVVDSSVYDGDEFDLLVKQEKTICGAFSKNPIEVGDLKIACLIPSCEISNSDGYSKMLKQMRRICLFLKYVFCDL